MDDKGTVRGSVSIQNHGHALAIRRQIPGKIHQGMRGPHLGLAEHKDIAPGGVAGNHNRARSLDEEQLAPIARPVGFVTAARNQPLPARAGKRHHPDPFLLRIVGVVCQPAAVGREYRGNRGKRRLQEWELWAQIYPREALPHDYLAAIYPTLGKNDKGVEEGEKAIELDPVFDHDG
jgi:hypothetical protein